MSQWIHDDPHTLPAPLDILERYKDKYLCGFVMGSLDKPGTVLLRVVLNEDRKTGERYTLFDIEEKGGDEPGVAGKILTFHQLQHIAEWIAHIEKDHGMREH